MSPSTLQIGRARKEEMEALFREHGTVTPAQVLEQARNPESTLHAAFTWDDGEAAERYRLIEATRLIRRTFVVLEVPGSGEERRVHMAVSLPEDRGSQGYRLMSDVLADPEQRDQLVKAATRELAAFRRKYAGVQELATLFAAIDEIVEPAA